MLNFGNILEGFGKQKTIIFVLAEYDPNNTFISARTVVAKKLLRHGLDLASC